MKYLLLSPRTKDICPIGTIQFMVSDHFFFSVEAIVLWTTEHREFANDSFVKNNKFIPAVQREFRR